MSGGVALVIACAALGIKGPVMSNEGVHLLMAIYGGRPAVKAPQRDLLGHIGRVPGLELAVRVLLDDFEADTAVGVLERQIFLPEPLTHFRDGHSALYEMLLPPGKRTDGCVIGNRSEEHTSELQSLMRISYAVFCLKKKNTTKPATTTKQT